jgi:polysaccharide biosynthesis/export protein
MDRARVAHRRLGWLLPWAALVACGCQTVRTPEEQIAKSSIPGELRKMSLPEYVVEPPDLLQVEVLETLPGRPITGERLVRPDGTITLGFYGDVYVAGLTTSEIKEKIVIHLRKFLNDEVLGLVEAQYDEADPSKPPKMVPMQPSKDPAKQLPPDEAFQWAVKNNDRVFVDVAAYNSKVYYVLGDVAAPGRLPITGNETVLDAIEYAGGIAPTGAPQNIRLVRPAPPGACCAQVLPVNIAAITQVGDTTTNYQLMPGDRLFVYRDPIVRTTVFLDRLAAPFNTVLNSILQYSFTARSVKSIDIPINGVAPTRPTPTGPTTVSPAR